MAQNKVQFGLKNVTLFPITGETESALTYGTAIKFPGAVSLSLDPSGDAADFFADDYAYYSEFANNGYEGDLEMALITDEVYEKILGYQKDKNGAIVENINSNSVPFGMAFEINGDKNQTRHILYKVSMSRPKEEANTREEKLKVGTVKMKYKALPNPFDGNIKAKITKGQTGYDEFYTKPYVPVPIVGV